MQRILQINICGSIFPIEEDAYMILKDYISALEHHFTGDEGAEIIEDIENRIAELFLMKLQTGALSIDSSDVRKVIDTLGAPGDLGEEKERSQKQQQKQQYTSYTSTRNYSKPRQGRLFRDPYNKRVGGVCSGLSHYFDVDPVIIRLIFVLFLFFGAGLVIYIVAWIVVPEARSREELHQEEPVTFHDITHNVEQELADLKRRAELMSKDLKDFFGKRKY
jgi:phage shock protein C